MERKEDSYVEEHNEQMRDAHLVKTEAFPQLKMLPAGAKILARSRNDVDTGGV